MIAEKRKGTVSSSGYFHEVNVSEDVVKKFDWQDAKERDRQRRKANLLPVLTESDLVKMKTTAFPWEDQTKVDLLNAPRQTIYARKCEVREVPISQVKTFLEAYHLQGNVKGQKINLGLYAKDDPDTLLEVMTFGTPRYNRKFQYELLRLCTKAGITVVGGSSKLFTYFVENYNPDSVISYCNNAKFDGSVYRNLGFILSNPGATTRHWWHPERKIHITDNFLRSKGFDLLFGHIWGRYGIGTSNDELMREHGFEEVYDAGQSTWAWYPNQA